MDFGKGFYVTDIKAQAEMWAKRVGYIRNSPAIVNVYRLDIDKVKIKFRYHYFDEYNQAWLKFIIENRNGIITDDIYDVVEGGVANDRVVDTVEAYMANLMPLDVALQRLSLHRPNSQLCIKTQAVIDTCFHFVESYQIP